MSCEFEHLHECEKRLFDCLVWKVYLEDKMIIRHSHAQLHTWERNDRSSVLDCLYWKLVPVYNVCNLQYLVISKCSFYGIKSFFMSTNCWVFTLQWSNFHWNSNILQVVTLGYRCRIYFNCSRKRILLMLLMQTTCSLTSYLLSNLSYQSLTQNQHCEHSFKRLRFFAWNPILLWSIGCSGLSWSSQMT